MLGTRRSKFAVLKAYERGSLALSPKNVKLRGREAAAPGDGLSGFIVGAEAPQLRGLGALSWPPISGQHCNFCRPKRGICIFFNHRLVLASDADLGTIGALYPARRFGYSGVKRGFACQVCWSMAASLQPCEQRRMLSCDGIGA